MTSCGEVIALEEAGDKRIPDHFRVRSNMKPRKALKHYPYFLDPSIVPRVKQYLEDNKDKVYVDIDDMVTELQSKYRDYAKRKRAAFKGMVEKAFSVVLKTYSLSSEDINRGAEDSESSDVSGMDLDSEDVDLIVEPNASNNQVMSMYMQQQALKKLVGAKSRSVTDDAKELIDISSDDDDDVDEGQTPAKRTKVVETADREEIVTPSIDVQPPSATNGQATAEEVRVLQEQSSSTIPTVTPIVMSERPKRKRAAADGGGGSSSVSLKTGSSQKKRREVPVLRPCCSFKDVGGSTAVLQEICKLLVHLRHPEIFKQIGVSPPRGFLLHGPPGCGKSLLANAIAGELGVPLVKVSAPELVAGVSGESEERIRDLFDQAVSLAPCVLFLDEIDAITPNRNITQREMERRIVAQLLTTLDELGEKEGGNQVLVVGATNRPDSLDPALRRAGRFDREVCMGIPDRDARAHILRVVCGRLALAPDVASDAGISELASLTPGFVGADLAALTREAAMAAVNRIFLQLQESQAEKLSDSMITDQITEVPSDRKEIQEELKEESKEDEKMEAERDVGTVPDVVSNVSGDDQQSMDTSEAANGSLMPSDEGLPAIEACEEVHVEVIPAPTSVNPEGPTVVGREPPATIAQLSEKESERGGDSKATADEIDVSATGELPHSTSNTCATSSTEIEIIIQGDNHEKEKVEAEAPDSILKADDEVEVLEVQVEKDPGQPTEPSEMCVSEPVDTSAAEKVVLKDLTLSQKLLPSSIWSPELCQLMSWLTDTPPLTPTQLNNLTITMADFHEALRHVQPSSKREGFATVPDVTWDDIGSLKNVRAELQLCVLAPVRYAKQFSQLGLTAPAGVMLCGPPGCGKTLLAKAVANEAGINFISVKGPELLNMYVGESERAVRQVFQRARNSAPCVIFFDELDALCPRRSDSGDNGVSSRVVNQLLTEMDGVEGRTAVFLMAASNRPDIIDPAVLRPGRLDKIVYVGLPNADDRKDILRALTKNGSKPQLSSDVDIAALACRPQFEGYSGADLASLVREAGVQALQEYISNGMMNDESNSLSVALRHFEAAAAKIRPSVTGKARKHYEKLQEMYSNHPNIAKPDAMDTVL